MERGKALLLHLALGIALAMFFASLRLARDGSLVGYFSGYLVAGLSVSLMCWGADRLWRSTVSHMLRSPLPWLVYLTRMPFWYMAGGTGYVIGMLAARKMGMLYIEDVPVYPLFAFGVYSGLGAQALLHLFRYLRDRRSPAVSSVAP